MSPAVTLTSAPPLTRSPDALDALTELVCSRCAVVFRRLEMGSIYVLSGTVKIGTKWNLRKWTSCCDTNYVENEL